MKFQFYDWHFILSFFFCNIYRTKFNQFVYIMLEMHSRMETRIFSGAKNTRQNFFDYERSYLIKCFITFSVFTIESNSLVNGWEFFAWKDRKHLTKALIYFSFIKHFFFQSFFSTKRTLGTRNVIGVWIGVVVTVVKISVFVMKTKNPIVLCGSGKKLDTFLRVFKAKRKTKEKN